MKIRLAVALGFMTWLGLSAVAEARVVRYHSRHPLPGKGAGFCYIDVPHIHAFAPVEPRLYRVHDDEYYFVGDPTPYGYEGDHYSFYGPHPVAEVEFGEPVYCYLDGPHYHWYQPTPAVSASFEFRGGAYWYVGAYDPVFYSARPRYVGINAVYAPIVYSRPVVDVAIRPPAFRGTIVAAPPVVSAGVTVGAPARGVIVAQPPVQRGAIVAPQHDNGRHEGWYKDHGNPHGGPVMAAPAHGPAPAMHGPNVVAPSRGPAMHGPNVVAPGRGPAMHGPVAQPAPAMRGPAVAPARGPAPAPAMRGPAVAPARGPAPAPAHVAAPAPQMHGPADRKRH
jgi:hypothetical protein